MKNLPTLVLIIVICLLAGLGLSGLCEVLFRSTKPAPAVAQNEIKILRKAEEKIDSLLGFENRQNQDKARSLAILAIAEQLKRVADALERR